MHCICQGKLYADHSCESALALQIVPDFSHLSFLYQILQLYKQVEIYHLSLFITIQYSLNIADPSSMQDV